MVLYSQGEALRAEPMRMDYQLEKRLSDMRYDFKEVNGFVCLVIYDPLPYVVTCDFATSREYFDFTYERFSDGVQVTKNVRPHFIDEAIAHYQANAFTRQGAKVELATRMNEGVAVADEVEAEWQRWFNRHQYEKANESEGKHAKLAKMLIKWKELASK